MVILIGFITFNAVPTVTRSAEPTTSSSSSSSSIGEDACYDNPVTQEDVSRKEVSVRIPAEVELRGEQKRKRRAAEEHDREDAVGVRSSTKM